MPSHDAWTSQIHVEQQERQEQHNHGKSENKLPSCENEKNSVRQVSPPMTSLDDDGKAEQDIGVYVVH